MEGFQQGSTYKNPVDPNDKDVRSTSRSQLTSIPSARGASGPTIFLLTRRVAASSLVSKSSAEARVKDHELPMAEQAGLQPLGFFYWCEGQYWYCAAGIQVQPLAGVQACL
jgi:hypothetical protein